VGGREDACGGQWWAVSMKEAVGGRARGRVCTACEPCWCPAQHKTDGVCGRARACACASTVCARCSRAMCWHATSRPSASGSWPSSVCLCSCRGRISPVATSTVFSIGWSTCHVREQYSTVAAPSARRECTGSGVWEGVHTVHHRAAQWQRRQREESAQRGVGEHALCVKMAPNAVGGHAVVECTGDVCEPWSVDHPSLWYHRHETRRAHARQLNRDAERRLAVIARRLHRTQWHTP
jgi:hypothetical protein